MGCTVWIGDSSGGAIAGIAPTAQSFEVSGLNKVAMRKEQKLKILTEKELWNAALHLITEISCI